jgi:hypothetical protein
MDRQDYKVFWMVMLALLLLTRLPAMASYLSIDNVNLAFSLEKFDPRIHQPQPPGYPFFVAFGRVVNFVFRDAERTFVVISILVSGLSLLTAFRLGSRMFSPWAGAAGAFLLLVNPVSWHSDLDGPLRPTLALFSLLTAYCSWRCWSGEKQFAFWGAVALGIGSGFRPDLGAFLFPVWLISSWVGTKSWRTVLQGVAVLAVIVAVWLGALVVAMEGIANFRSVMFGYAVEQSQQYGSVVLGSPLGAWLRQINRLVIWNGLAIVGWIWAVPFYFRKRDRLPVGSSQSVFLFLWLVPGLIVQALIHIAAPGHTLFSVPAFCILGGYVLSMIRGRDLVLASALIFNVMLFLDYFPLPAGSTDLGRGTPSIKNAMIFGTFESSIGQVRFLDDVTRVTLKEIREFTPADRPSVIISTDMPYDQWFMQWQVGRYYLPRQDFWVLYNKMEKKGAEHIRRDRSIEARDTAPVRVPIFREGRILWLIEPNGVFHKQLAGVQKLSGGAYVFYSDITRDSPPFSIDGFEIVPSTTGPGDHGIQ